MCRAQQKRGQQPQLQKEKGTLGSRRCRGRSGQPRAAKRAAGARPKRSSSRSCEKRNLCATHSCRGRSGRLSAAEEVAGARPKRLGPIKARKFEGPRWPKRSRACEPGMPSSRGLRGDIWAAKAAEIGQGGSEPLRESEARSRAMEAQKVGGSETRQAGRNCHGHLSSRSCRDCRGGEEPQRRSGAQGPQRSRGTMPRRSRAAETRTAKQPGGCKYYLGDRGCRGGRGRKSPGRRDKHREEGQPS